MATIDRRKFAAGFGALPFLASTPALAQRRRRKWAADLVIDSIQWSHDAGGSWHNGSVPEASDLLFRATVRNRGQTATPPNVSIRVDFRVNNEVVSWSDSYLSSLAANATITLQADGGPDGNAAWEDVSPGTWSIQAAVDGANLIVESNENNNTLSTSVVVDGTTSGFTVVANDCTVSTPMDTALTIDVLASVVAPAGTTLSLTSVQSGTDTGGIKCRTDNGGTASIAPDGRTIEYTTPAGFQGTDGFTYEVTAT
jgi:hypothetical protein